MTETQEVSGKTAFFFDEKCFWHQGGNYAIVSPVGGLVQPMIAGGLPEAPETKRRLKNLMDVTGLSSEMLCQSASPAMEEDLRRVHTGRYLEAFKKLSDTGGGELGLRTPFGPGAYEIAGLSTGLVIGALSSVLRGEAKNAYALSRPPGHHCLPDWPNGFCLLANIAVAIEAVKAQGLVDRVAVVDWDVHHGNGTEAIFYRRPDVLTISIHQEHVYPHDTGDISDTGDEAGNGTNMNIPLPPGAGHATYLEAMERLIVPKLKSFSPDLIVVACGFDASGVDPMARMLCTAQTFRLMTRQLMEMAGCRLAMAHEGGYSELHVPFCGHAVIEELTGSAIRAADPIDGRIMGQQPSARLQNIYSEMLGEMVSFFGVQAKSSPVR